MRGSYAWPRALAAVFFTLSSAPAFAKPAWDQAANIKSAAQHLVQLQRGGGLNGAFQFISACYKTHSLASSYSQSFEACIIQDYILTTVAAAIYQRLPQDTRRKMGSPEPDAMIAAMSRRVSQAFAQYKVPEADARQLLARADREGLPAFTKAAFPNGQPSDEAAQPPEAAPPSDSTKSPEQKPSEKE